MSNISSNHIKITRRAFSFGALGLIIVSCTGSPSVPISIEPITDDKGLGLSENVTAEGIIFANRYREAAGVKKLSPSGPCQAAALRHALNMAMTDMMDHIVPGIPGVGELGNVATRLKKYGVPRPHAENVSYGYRTVERAVDMWYQSPKHHESLMNPSYKHFGMAGATHPNSGGNKTYWCSVYSA